MTEKEYLRDVDIFWNFTDEELDRILKIAGTESFPRGHTILEEGKVGRALYIIKKGAVNVRKGRGKRMTVLARLGAGSYFGEMSLIDEHPVSASVVAAAPTTCVTITKENLNVLLNDLQFANKLLWGFVRTLNLRLRETSHTLLKKTLSSGKKPR